MKRKINVMYVRVMVFKPSLAIAGIRREDNNKVLVFIEFCLFVQVTCKLPLLYQRQH